MATTLIVPGINGGNSGHWLAWFQAKISGAVTLHQDSNETNLPAWSTKVRRAIDRIDGPVCIVAHGFGCLAAVQAAAENDEQIAGAMLVAPLDPDRLLHASSLPPQPLSFTSVVVASSNDPHMRIDKAAFWADFWNSNFIDIGRKGHIDPDAGFGAWQDGLEIYEDLRRASSDIGALRSRDVIEHFGRAL